MNNNNFFLNNMYMLTYLYYIGKTRNMASLKGYL